eukprot:127880_1
MTTVPGSLNPIKMKSKRQPSQCDHYSGNHSCTRCSNAQCTYNGDCDTLRRIGIDAKSPTRTIAPSTSMTSSVSPIIHLKSQNHHCNTSYRKESHIHYFMPLIY